ncbi:MAG: hypothetical protein IK092_03895, partial [Muribaculaceae bacterium]|nr:hypothetical protein [Muribaculaceae bacterium]
MKKIFSLALVAAVCATMTISCNKNGSDPVTPQEDSLSMLLGMGNGSALASQVMQDSTNEIDKDAFIRGFEEAINADTSVVGRSYDIGRMQGQRMRQQFDMMKQQLGVNVSYSTFLKSFEKTFKGKPLDDIKMAKLQEDFNAIIQKIQAEQEAKRNALANNNLKAGEAYLNKAVKEGMTKTQSGIAYKMLAQGNGDNFKDGDVVMVKYKGTLID